ncbi:hypothetical protein JCM19240_5976 [Vibrio maritimus]|uniref:Uncharacterized protein n=1 Tax=Vibrio maritimus TaxID=990268 RepID=A0A090T1H2_9VIBR|nr:hypothetical protein JCM19240_5976 [Vibrio maritimus]
MIAVSNSGTSVISEDAGFIRYRASMEEVTMIGGYLVEMPGGIQRRHQGCC